MFRSPTKNNGHSVISRCYGNSCHFPTKQSTISTPLGWVLWQLGEPPEFPRFRILEPFDPLIKGTATRTKRMTIWYCVTFTHGPWWRKGDLLVLYDCKIFFGSPVDGTPMLWSKNDRVIMSPKIDGPLPFFWSLKWMFLADEVNSPFLTLHFGDTLFVDIKPVPIQRSYVATRAFHPLWGLINQMNALEKSPGWPSE